MIIFEQKVENFNFHWKKNDINSDFVNKYKL